jgi:phage terminase large subunit GpA-like protein
MICSPDLPEGIDDGGKALAQAFVNGLRPPMRRNVDVWAQEERYVSSESGSPKPGKWENDYAPELIEPMRCMSFDHPARTITWKKSAQVGGSETGLNLIGSIIQDNPCPILVILPTTEEIKNWVRIKFQPMVDATPPLRERVRDIKSRDEDSSTMTFKRFPGGWLRVTGANSSSGLQMISVRVIIYEEVSEYPFDVDGRGDPVDLGHARRKAYEGREKEVFISTPGVKGSCRITKRYEESDQRIYFMPCPHCGTWQPFVWSQFDHEASPPVYICKANGCVIAETEKRAMRLKGMWIKTFPGDGAPHDYVFAEDIDKLGDRANPDVLMDGRQPGFAINALYSSTESWSELARAYHKALDGDELMKVFAQQCLGEPWEASGEAPDAEKLFDRRVQYEWRRIPPGALFLTGATDVQGNRLEWAVYAFGIGYTRWLVDKGVIEGDPNSPEPWKELTKVFEKTWLDARGKPWKVDLFGVDSGYLSQVVYRWVRSHAHTGRVYALDGRDGWKLPAIGTPVKKDVDFEGRKIGAVLLWPVGTWGLKSELYSAIGKLIKGPDTATGLWSVGTAFYGEACDKAYLEQLTAEQVIERKTRSGIVSLVWEKIKNRRNEALDIAVYCAALAHHLADGLTSEEWVALAAERSANVEDVQRDMQALWSPETVQAIVPALTAASEDRPAVKSAVADGAPADAGEDFFSGSEDPLS